MVVWGASIPDAGCFRAKRAVNGLIYPHVTQFLTALVGPAIGFHLDSHLCMAVRCSHCNSSTVWDDAAGSSVCTACGSLADPSQSVLTSTQYATENPVAEPSLLDRSASTTLKRLRADTDWDLAGQGKEARDRKNAHEMSEFIKSLAVSFNATGLSPRAITLFSQAKAASSFRWGHKSRSVAAACFAIALREANRPDCLRDIANVLNVSATAVSREFTSITTTLKLSLHLVDPSVYIATLQNHLAPVVQGGNQEQQQLPISLVTSLRATCLRAAGRTATSISQLLARLSPDHEILRLPVAATACGIFVLALEAENRAVLNPVGDLAQYLGASCHAAKSSVMGRYKIVQDEIARWIDTVPWLDKYDNKGGRAKVPKRLVVARGLKDVIKFQEDVWHRQISPLSNIKLPNEDEKDELNHRLNDVPNQKRMKLSRTMTQTTRFLLDPMACSLSSGLLTSSKQTSSSEPYSGLLLAAYILTNPSTSYMRRLPSRLQLLAQVRGGTTEQHISDDELFLPGELESWLRSKEEIKLLSSVLGWGDEAPESFKSIQLTTKHQRPQGASGHKELPADELSPRKKSRINMDALSRFLADSDGDSGIDSQGSAEDVLLGLEEVMSICDFDNDDKDDDLKEAHSSLVNQSLSTHREQESIVSSTTEDDAELILEEWRPPSPGMAGPQDMRYDEEQWSPEDDNNTINVYASL